MFCANHERRKGGMKKRLWEFCVGCFDEAFKVSTSLLHRLCSLERGKGRVSNTNMSFPMPGSREAKHRGCSRTVLSRKLLLFHSFFAFLKLQLQHDASLRATCIANLQSNTLGLAYDLRGVGQPKDTRHILVRGLVERQSLPFQELMLSSTTMNVPGRKIFFRRSLKASTNTRMGIQGTRLDQSDLFLGENLAEVG